MTVIERTDYRARRRAVVEAGMSDDVQNARAQISRALADMSSALEALFVANVNEAKAEAEAKAKEIAPVEPLLCTIQAGTTIIGRSKRAIADMIARGQIQAVKSDRRTLLVVQSLKDYVASLPAAKGTKNPRRSPLHPL
jgi:hypothetical protein